MSEVKLEDLKEDLFAWFPPKLHKSRKLPGGGNHWFLPHQAIADRLNDIAFGLWSEEYTDPVITGKRTTIMCKLTICGVTRVGIADNQTDPDLNEEGKEKIIGSVPVNTGRAAFKNAAGRFGLGVYLRYQKNNLEMQKYLAGHAGTNTPQPSKPQPNTPQPNTPQPKQANQNQEVKKKPDPGLYPQHNTISNTVMKMLDVPFSYVKFVLKDQFGGVTPSDLDREKLLLYLEKLVIKGKRSQYPDVTLLLNTYRSYLVKTNNNVIEALNQWEIDDSAEDEGEDGIGNVYDEEDEDLDIHDDEEDEEDDDQDF